MFSRFVFVVLMHGWNAIAQSSAQTVGGETEPVVLNGNSSTERSCLETIRRGFLNPLTLSHGEPIGTNCRDICVGRNGPEPNGKFWYPGNDCRAYIKCVNWEAEAWLCPLLRIFDTIVSKCTLPEWDKEKKREQCQQPVPMSAVTVAMDIDPIWTEEPDGTEVPIEAELEMDRDENSVKATTPSDHDHIETEVAFKSKTATTTTTTDTIKAVKIAATTENTETSEQAFTAITTSIFGDAEGSLVFTETSTSVPPAEIMITSTGIIISSTYAVNTAKPTTADVITQPGTTVQEWTTREFPGTRLSPAIPVSTPSSSTQQMRIVFYQPTSVKPDAVPRLGQTVHIPSLDSFSSTSTQSTSSTHSRFQYEVEDELTTTAKVITAEKKPPVLYGRYRIPGTLFKFPIKKPRPV